MGLGHWSSRCRLCVESSSGIHVPGRQSAQREDIKVGSGLLTIIPKTYLGSSCFLFLQLGFQ